MRKNGIYKRSNKHLYYNGSQNTFVYWLEFYVTRLVENKHIEYFMKLYNF